MNRLIFVFAIAAMAAAQTPPSTLSKPSTAEAVTSADGFIRRWLILEPVVAKGLTDSVVRTTVSQFEKLAVEAPREGDKAGADLTWHAVDTRNYNVNLYHFARSFTKPTSDVLFWVYTVIHAPRDMTGVRLAIGSNSASIWWVNGSEVIGIYGDRQTVIDDGVSKRLALKKGPNVVRAAIVNGGGATDFCARFLDADDRPVQGLKVTLR